MIASQAFDKIAKPLAKRCFRIGWRIAVASQPHYEWKHIERHAQTRHRIRGSSFV